MIGKTNAGTGKCVALIHAYYKAGTSCTCTKGLRVFHSDTSGEYVFLLPETGDWTVTGTSSADVEKSITVTVARGESKLITLDTLIPPSDRATYQEVEYLNFLHGGANIPIGPEASAGAYDVEFTKIRFHDLRSSQHFLILYGRNVGGAGNEYINVTIGDNYRSSEPVTLNVEHNMIVHMSNLAEGAGASITVDGDAILDVTARPSFSGSITIGRGTSGVNDNVSARYWGITLKSSGTLIGNFVPCKRRIDGHPGFYDVVNNTFYPGQKNSSTTTSDVLTVIELGPAIGT